MLLEKREYDLAIKKVLYVRGKEMTRWQLSANPDQEI